MGTQVPERLAILLERETKAFMNLALVLKNGTPPGGSARSAK